MDPDLRTAVRLSPLRDLPDSVLAELTMDAARVQIPAGAVTHWAGDPAPHLDLVISGVVRVFVTAPDGRQMTIRYCRDGALIGAMSLFAPAFAMPANTQALTDAHLLKLRPHAAQRVTARDPRVARAFLGELAERALRFVYEIPGSTFATVRQRVARHLLDLASGHVRDHGADGGPAHELVVTVNQRQLAEAVGTAREVVVRVLRELREEGIVRTGRDRMVIVDPARLIHDHEWNSGS